MRIQIPAREIQYVQVPTLDSGRSVLDLAQREVEFVNEVEFTFQNQSPMTQIGGLDDAVDSCSWLRRPTTIFTQFTHKQRIVTEA